MKARFIYFPYALIITPALRMVAAAAGTSETKNGAARLLKYYIQILSMHTWMNICA